MKCKLATGTVLTLLLAGTLITTLDMTQFKAALTQFVPESEGMMVSSDINGPVFQKGMSYVSWPPNFDSADSNESLRLLRLTNTEWVAICIFWYQENITSAEIYPSYDTPSNSSVIQAISRCHELGMKVMLKPMVDLLDGNWRGLIPPSTEWFANYTNFIDFWAEFSQGNKVDMLCVGCEFYGSDGQTASWENIIATVRQRYSGPITYAAANYQNVHWWGSMDYVGIDAYFSLTNKSNPTVEELKAGWSPRVEEMSSWQATVNKPIIFTEIGYRSADGTNEAPADATTPASIDLQEQVDCYNATFQTFSDKDWFYGFYWWNWETSPNAGGENDTGYTPQNKPVQSLITSRYASAIHDVAVTDVTLSKTVVGQGYDMNINVTAANLGDRTETFNVTAYANVTLIASQNVTLPAGNSTTVTFVWNTTGFANGNYTISAYAWPVQGETKTDNNNCTGGWVIVSLVGDITGPNGWPDGKVDIMDLNLMARNFGKTVPPGPPNCDLTGPTPGLPDGKIDIRDISALAKHFGETTPRAYDALSSLRILASFHAVKRQRLTVRKTVSMIF
jgi:hypothetical protein